MPPLVAIESRVSALFVRRDGPYPARLLDWWDESRDATRYDGNNPIVAHPPCKRWGRFWSADGSSEPGNDGGLFASALVILHRCGGILEHPEGSHAWRVFDLPEAKLGGWTKRGREWATAVYQRNYGHRALKLTWLLCVSDREPPPLDWSKPEAGGVYLSQPGRCSRAKPRPTCPCDRCRDLYGEKWRGQRTFQRITPAENERTPDAFADLLIEIALNCRTGSAIRSV